MKHILSPQRSRLTTEHSESCVKLKVTNYTPDIKINIKQSGAGTRFAFNFFNLCWKFVIYFSNKR